MVDPDSGTTASTYDDAGQLIRIANPHSETTTLVYDAAGREIRNELDNGTDNATSYDPAGRVVGRSATDSGSNVIAQYDDALDCVGNRTSMWDSDGESSNWNDDPLRQQEIDDYLPTTTGLSWMTFTLHQWDQFTLSQWDSLPLDSAAIQADSSFYHFDGTENVRKLTDDMEAVTDEYAFDAFGNELSSSGSTANSQRYKGRLLAYTQDPEAAPQPQYALHHRHYDPSTGVFTSRDPAEDDSNLYRYVKNNPLNREDPSGLEESAEELINRGFCGLESIDESALQAFTESLSGDHAVYRGDRMISVTAEGRRFVFYKFQNARSRKNVRYGESIPGQEARWRLAKIVSENVSTNALLNGKEVEDSHVFYESLSSSLEFTLHALPGGTFADRFVGGTDDSWGYVALASAGDLVMAGSLLKAGAKSGARLARAGMVVDAAGAGAAAYQLSTDERHQAAHAGEFLLRIASLGLGVNLSTLKSRIAPKGAGTAIDLSRSAGAARQAVNWRSRKFFGHTFNQHGAGPKMTRRLTGRAGGTGQPQGQWLDNERAAEFLNDLPDIEEAATVRIPQGLGRVIMPDGSFVTAKWARVVVSPSGFRTAFPVIP